MCVAVCACGNACVHIFHRHSQCASESEKHCLCGLGDVVEVWSSGPGLEESILRHQPQWTLPGNGLAITFLPNYKNNTAVKKVLALLNQQHAVLGPVVINKHGRDLRGLCFLKTIITLRSLTKQTRCGA